MAVAPWFVSDELWELVEPLLPRKERRFRYPGRKRLPDRQALQGILFVLHIGIAWQHVPGDLGFGSGVTCWRRLDEWQRAGVWQELHAVLLARLRAAGELDWSRAVVPAPNTTSSSTDPGSRSPSVTGGNRNDVTQLIPLLDGVPAVRGAIGRPRRRPERLIADCGDDHDKYRRLLWQRGVKPMIARRQTDTWLRPRPRPLGRRAHLRLATQLQAPGHPLRTPRRHAPRIAALGCCLVCYRRLASSV